MFEKVQELKALLVSAGRGGARDEESEKTYRDLRTELLRDGTVAPLLPRWLREYRGVAEFWPFIKGKSPHYAGRDEFLRSEFAPALDALERSLLDSRTLPQQFFAAGSHHDAFLEIRKVIALATSAIYITDPWVDHSLWSLLTNIPKGCAVRVLTKNMKGDFVVEGQKFSQQHRTPVEIRIAGSVHDRFILIDGQQCWHVGASIKDAGAKAFLMSELLNEGVRNATISALENEWNNGSVVL